MCGRHITILLGWVAVILIKENSDPSFKKINMAGSILGVESLLLGSSRCTVLFRMPVDPHPLQIDPADNNPLERLLSLLLLRSLPE